MNPHEIVSASECVSPTTTRRQFLQQAAGLAAGAAVLPDSLAIKWPKMRRLFAKSVPASVERVGAWPFRRFSRSGGRLSSKLRAGDHAGRAAGLQTGGSIV